jgi:hypothetical protein
LIYLILGLPEIRTNSHLVRLQRIIWYYRKYRQERNTNPMPVFLLLDDSPGGAMVICNTQPAADALFGVDDIGFFTLADSAGGTFERAAAALDAVFQYFISHGGLL